MHGFERIPVRPPVAAAVIRNEPETHRSLHALRAAVAAADYLEVINFTFVEPEWEADFAGNPNPIRLLNPIASQLSVMRSTMLGGLVANLRYNLNRRASRVRVFEIGRVFLRAPGMPEGPLEVAGIRQPVRIGAAAFGPALEEQWGVATRMVDFFDVKGDLQNLLSPRQAGLNPLRTPPCTRGARHESCSTVARSAGWVSCIRCGRKNTSCPRPRFCSRWMRRRCNKSNCRLFREVLEISRGEPRYLGDRAGNGPDPGHPG